MRKNVKVLLAIFLIFIMSTTLSASSLIRDITGKENKGITVKYNNQVQNLKDGNGSPVYPVVINGSTYLPVRAIAEMLGADITWDGETETIFITGNGNKKDVDSAVPTDLPPANKNNSNSNSNKNNNTNQKQNNSSLSNQNKATGNIGTISDPIKIGSSYSYNYTSGYKNDTANADYTVTIKKVEPITRDDIKNLGFEKPKANALIEYVMVTMKVDVTNATYEGNEEYCYLEDCEPDLDVVTTAEGNRMIGDTSFGFDGCLSDAILDATKCNDYDYMKVYPNDSKSYSAEGKVIVSVFKSSKNMLSIYNNNYYDCDNFVYFELN